MMRKTDFSDRKMIHWSFLLKQSWGTYVVGIPVLIFVFMLISGIILWWPKNKAARKQRFSFKWKNVKNWKRKNYDLHNVLGFYASVFALIFPSPDCFMPFYSFSHQYISSFQEEKPLIPTFHPSKQKRRLS
jgi:uncharacterized iron-regulated membrane protein